jgi:hypothetical protein
MQGDCKTGDTHPSGLEATARTGNYSGAVSEPDGVKPPPVARDVQNGPFWADWDGTVMEQSGRNGWQTLGYPKGRKWPDLAPNRCHRLPPVAVWIAW